jgi:LEA14-like dessication related protein
MSNPCSSKRPFPRWIGMYFALLLILTGCAGMPTEFEKPSMTITSIALKNSNTIAPQFDVTLHITNPNRIPLNIAGMSYDIFLAGNKVVSGVSNNFPVIQPYGEADVQLNAIVSLLGGINLLSDLMRRNRDQIDYEFNARLDVGRMVPRVTISNTGVIPFR